MSSNHLLLLLFISLFANVLGQTANATTSVATTRVPTTAVGTTAVASTRAPTTAVPVVTTGAGTTAALTTAAVTTSAPTTAAGTTGATTAAPTTAVQTTAASSTATTQSIFGRRTTGVVTSGDDGNYTGYYYNWRESDSAQETYNRLVGISAGAIIGFFFFGVLFTIFKFWWKKCTKPPKKEYILEDAEEQPQTTAPEEGGSKLAKIPSTSVADDTTAVLLRMPMKQFADLMVEDDFLVIKAAQKFIPAESMESVARDIYIIAESKGKNVQLIKFFVISETKRAKHLGHMFKEGTLANYVMNIFLQSVGKSWMRLVLYDDIQEVLRNKAKESGVSFEVKSERLAPGEVLQSNKETLERACSVFLKSIYDSVSDSPPELRAVCWHIQQTVSNKFANSVQSLLADIVFKRLVCAAVRDPVTWKLTKTPPSIEAQRGLKFISKTLEYLSAGNVFGKKSKALTFMNDWMEHNRILAFEFLQMMASVPRVAQATVKQIAFNPLEEDVKEKAQDNLFAFIKTIKGKMEEKYGGQPFLVQLNDIISQTDNLKSYLSKRPKMSPSSSKPPM